MKNNTQKIVILFLIQEERLFPEQVTNPLELAKSFEFFKPFIVNFLVTGKKKIIIASNRGKVKSLTVLKHKKALVTGGIFIVGFIFFGVLIGRSSSRVAQPFPNPIVYSYEIPTKVEVFEIRGAVFVNNTCSIQDFVNRYSRLPLQGENLSNQAFFETYGFEKSAFYIPGEQGLLKLNSTFIYGETNQRLLRSVVDQELIKRSRFPINSNCPTKIDSCNSFIRQNESLVVPLQKPAFPSLVKNLKFRLIEIHSLGINQPTDLLSLKISPENVAKARSQNEFAKKLLSQFVIDFQTVLESSSFSLANYQKSLMDELLKLQNQVVETGVKIDIIFQILQEHKGTQNLPPRVQLFGKYYLSDYAINFLQKPQALELGVDLNLLSKLDGTFALNSVITNSAFQKPTINVTIETNKNFSNSYLNRVGLGFETEIDLLRPCL